MNLFFKENEIRGEKMELWIFKGNKFSGMKCNIMVTEVCYAFFYKKENLLHLKN
jgi:hypothetical protein